MRKGSPAHRGISTLPARGRRRLVQRPLPSPGCGLQRCASTWRPCAPIRAGTDDHSAPSHIHLHHWTHFYDTINIEDRTTLGEFNSLRQIAGLNERVSTDDVFRLGKRSIRHRLLLAFHQLAGTLERLPLVFDMTVLAKLLEPGHPLLHRLLGSLRGSPALPAAIKKYKLTHGHPP